VSPRIPSSSRSGDPHLLRCCGYLLWRSTGLNTDSWRPPWGDRHDHGRIRKTLPTNQSYNDAVIQARHVRPVLAFDVHTSSPKRIPGPGPATLKIDLHRHQVQAHPIQKSSSTFPREDSTRSSSPRKNRLFFRLRVVIVVLMSVESELAKKMCIVCQEEAEH
jgi:hypothetical protein